MPDQPETIRVAPGAFCRDFCGLRKDCPIYVAGNSLKQGYQVAKDALVARAKQGGDGEVVPAVLQELVDPDTVEQLPRATFLKAAHLVALPPLIQELQRARDACANHRMAQPAVQDALRAQKEAERQRAEDALFERKLEEMAGRSPTIRALMASLQGQPPVSPIAGSYIPRPEAAAAPAATPAAPPPPPPVAVPVQVAATAVPVPESGPRNGDAKHAELRARAQAHFKACLGKAMSDDEAIFETYNTFRAEKLSHESLAMALGEPWSKMKVWKAYEREKAKRNGTTSTAPGSE